ncbi:ATP-binding protein [Streptomyces lycii]|uniref:ATP-binding protein n=1 Tax=Streptomyces lycii TaxID=2654337 RepID=A0ABQ7FQ98_9ACTN|nr:ATP-binding protein [Streptomyces lycii]KAF4411099.1 ATP-binding protein [Streptomyces lycii]
MKSQSATTGSPARAPQMTVRLSSTSRGARLARRLTGQQLADWGFPYDSAVSQAVTAVVAELAANAVTHGRVADRVFRLGIRLGRDTVRVEVTDTRPDRMPPIATGRPDADAESGRGLLLVAAYADRWGCETRTVGTKTAWVEVDLAGRGCTS